MSDETKVYEVFTTQDKLDGLPLGYSGRIWSENVGGTAPIRCALIPIGDGLLPGTRVRDVDGRTCAVVGPAQVDGIAVPASAFTVVQYGDLEVESIGTASLTPIPDEPRTYSEEQVREAIEAEAESVLAARLTGWALKKAVQQSADDLLARLREGER